MTVRERQRTAVGHKTTSRFRRGRNWQKQQPRKPLYENEGRTGWLFTAPVVIGIFVFLVLPILLTLWVSFRDWNGITSPFDSTWVGLQNYQDLLTEDGIRRTDFAKALRNNLYYVLGVVPIQTLLAFVLAVILNQKFLKGKGFFRTAYYFPSITSTIAISLIFLFLFQTQGMINKILPFKDLNWTNNANGLIHNLLGVFGIDRAPGWLADTELIGLSLWEWLAGPSVALSAIMMLVIWTTTGTLMLIFLAGLQSISPAIEEAAVVDGATPFQQFRRITVPLMKPTIFFVVTIGVIGSWKVFDQIYAIGFGGPRKTTITPAFWIYFQMFTNSKAGLAAAIAMILLVIIVGFTLVQRRIVGRAEEA